MLENKKSTIKYIIVFVIIALMFRSCVSCEKPSEENEALKERSEYTLELEQDCAKALQDEPNVKRVEVKTYFMTNEVKYLNNGKTASYLKYHDDIRVRVYVEDAFSKASYEEILETLKEYRYTCSSVFSKAYDEKAPYYKECMRIGKIPGEEKSIVREAKVDLYVVCGNDTYGYPSEQYSYFYLNDKLIDIKKIGSGSGNSSSGNSSSGGNKYQGNGYSGPQFDPDDYDNSDDYADDAWGNDFDDWDDASDYWDNW